GPNGAGKTTLFNLIAGRMTPDFGTVSHARSTRIGYLLQEPQLHPERTLIAEVRSAFDDLIALEHEMHALSETIARHHDDPGVDEMMVRYDKLTAQFEAAGGYTMEQRIGEVLDGLGFSKADEQLPISAMSGGQRGRAALGKLLLRDQSYLLLDEPTNHLDIDAVRWLETFLLRHRGGALIISHDRYLLDRVTSRILDLRDRKLKSYAGNYSSYVEQRERDTLTAHRQYEMDREFIEKERAFINKHIGSQRTAEAKGRLKRLERRIADGEFVREKPSEHRAIALSFDDVDTHKGEIIRLVELAKAFGEKKLFEDVNVGVMSGRRLGITGPNGTGKTTILKILQGEHAPDAGQVHIAPRARIGYFAQQESFDDPNRSVFLEIQTNFDYLDETSIRNLLARFLFFGDDAYKSISALSGGERSRIRLLKLILDTPDVLLLDEPTNHLDIQSCEALEGALREFPGTIVVVSHDRYFIDKLVDQLLVVRPEGHRLVVGNYSRYVQIIDNENAEQRAEVAEEKKQTRAKVAAKKKTAAPQSPFAKFSLEKIEAEIETREQRVREIETAFADAETYRDAEKSVRLREEFEGLKTELAELTQIWEVKIEELEKA
ncbi:MAG: ribosomal protection-like ABC-F family protein, partial [Phycisphaerae bacterium]